MLFVFTSPKAESRKPKEQNKDKDLSNKTPKIKKATKIQIQILFIRVHPHKRPRLVARGVRGACIRVYKNTSLPGGYARLYGEGMGTFYLPLLANQV